MREVKTLAEKYRDVNVAKREGYTTDNKCTTAEMLGFPKEMGAMGLHYVRRDLLGLPPKPAPRGSGRVHGTGTYTDFRKPAMLVYEPQPDGALQLVAVENLVFEPAWRAAGMKGPPGFRGESYVLLTDKPQTKVDEAHGWEPHYELHLWLFRDNPNGTIRSSIRTSHASTTGRRNPSRRRWSIDRRVSGQRELKRARLAHSRKLPTECWMASLFLSYSREDVQRIEPLAAALESAGHDVWWDDHIAGGEEFSGAIEQALNRPTPSSSPGPARRSNPPGSRRGGPRPGERPARPGHAGRLPTAVGVFGNIRRSTCRNGTAAVPRRSSRCTVRSTGRSAGHPAIRSRSGREAAPWLKRVLSWQAAAAAAFVLLLLVGGGVLYPRMAASGASRRRSFSGDFALVSARIAQELPNLISREVLAAFGAENAVAVVAPAGGAAEAAPFAMDGSIGKEGPVVRYTMNLKNSRSGVLLWSQSYDRDPADALAPRQVAVQASQIVRCGLWGAAAYKKRMARRGVVAVPQVV